MLMSAFSGERQGRWFWPPGDARHGVGDIVECAEPNRGGATSKWSPERDPVNICWNALNQIGAAPLANGHRRGLRWAPLRRRSSASIDYLLPTMNGWKQVLHGCAYSPWFLQNTRQGRLLPESSSRAWILVMAAERERRIHGTWDHLISIHSSEKTYMTRASSKTSSWGSGWPQTVASRRELQQSFRWAQAIEREWGRLGERRSSKVSWRFSWYSYSPGQGFYGHFTVAHDGDETAVSVWVMGANLRALLASRGLGMRTTSWRSNGIVGGLQRRPGCGLAGVMSPRRGGRRRLLLFPSPEAVPRAGLAPRPSYWAGSVGCAR
jgi:hypothetical protein